MGGAGSAVAFRIRGQPGDSYFGSLFIYSRYKDIPCAPLEVFFVLDDGISGNQIGRAGDFKAADCGACIVVSDFAGEVHNPRYCTGGKERVRGK